MGTAVSDATENLALCSDVTQQLPSGPVVPVEWFLITVRDVLELCRRRCSCHRFMQRVVSYLLAIVKYQDE